MNKTFIFFVFLLINLGTYAQGVSGIIKDEKGDLLPYVTVYVKEAKFGTSSNKDGKYSLTLNEGKYTIVFQSLGYGTVEKQIVVGKVISTLNVQLSVKPYQISTVNVSSSNEDKAYAIMRKAIAMAPYYRNQIREFNSEVYMKGTVKIIKLSWAVKFATRKEKDAPKEGTMYLQESLNNIHFIAPDTYNQNVKMIRSNFPSDDSGSDNVMGFINASLYQAKISDIILPLAPYAFNHYKFRYAGFSKDGDRIVNKIRVIPKRKSKQLVEGYIYIADNYWNLHSADLSVESVIGTIQIKQTFGEIEKNVWLPVTYNFDIKGKFMGNEGTVNYISSVKYKSVIVNKNIKTPTGFNIENEEDKTELTKTSTKKNTKKKSESKLKKEQKRKDQIEKLMKKEELTNKEMYQLSNLVEKDAKTSADTSTIKSLEIKRTHNITIDSTAHVSDSAKWNIIRPVALTSDEEKGMADMQKDIAGRDSANKKADSLQKVNKWYNIILFGRNWDDEKKKRHINFSGLINPDQFRFNTVDGFVIGMDFYYRRYFEKNDIRLNPSIAYAFNRKILMGKLRGRFSYAPLQRGNMGISLGSESTDFNKKNGVSTFGNTLSSLFFRTNYMKLYEHQFCEIYNQIDLLNGMELRTGINYYNRTMLKNYSDFSFFFREQKDFTSNFPENDSVYNNYLPNHQAAIGSLSLSYTPEFFYYVYKNRKVMSSSRFPTFSVDARFGVNNIIGSDVNFIHLEFRIHQRVHIGPSNSLTYTLIYGDFLNKSTLYFTDYKHFNTQEIPVVFGEYSNSYQLLRYYKFSTDSAYSQMFVSYQSPYLAIKYLPWFSNRMWMENLYVSGLFTEKLKPYWEIGYAMNQIGLIGGIGFFAGFDKFKFSMFGIKATLTLGGEIRL